MEKVGVLEPTMKGDSQLHPHQILIGSIPIELPTTVSVMATFVKEEENVSMTTPGVKVMLTPKRAKINASSTKMAKVESVSTSVERTDTSTRFARGPQVGVKSKKN